MGPTKSCKLYDLENPNKLRSEGRRLLFRYVIRQVVYEVGVLIDVNDTDSDESDGSESSELV